MVESVPGRGFVPAIPMDGALLPGRLSTSQGCSTANETLTQATQINAVRANPNNLLLMRTECLLYKQKLNFFTNYGTVVPLLEYACRIFCV